MKTYKLDETGAMKGLILWPLDEVKALFTKMQKAQNYEQLAPLVLELSKFILISATTKFYPDEDLADIFTELPLERRVEILTKELPPPLLSSGASKDRKPQRG